MNTTRGKADMHMHTNVSDGIPDVKDLLAHVSTLGLDVIAITDHDLLDASLWAYEHQDEYPFHIVPAMEVTALDAHILAWWVTEIIPADMPMEETVQAIHEAGGIAVLAHPFHIHVKESWRGFRRYGNDIELIERVGFDAIEVVNAGVVLVGANGYAKRVCRQLSVSSVGNSDAHSLAGIGSGYTEFAGDTPAALRAAIEQKQTYAGGGIWPLRAYIDYADGVRTGKVSFDFEGVRAAQKQNHSHD